MKISDPQKGIFPIGVAAEMLGISPRQLRVYENNDLIEPARSDGNRRLYSQDDLEVLALIHHLIAVKKVNIAGVRVIFELLRMFPHERDDLWRVVANRMAGDDRKEQNQEPQGQSVAALLKRLAEIGKK